MITKPFKLILFIIFYVKEVIKTNLIVAREVLTPTHYMKPGLVDIDVSHINDRQLIIFCNLLTMTPGSMIVDVAEDKSSVKVHILYLNDRKEAISEIEENYLKKVKELF